ncbi:MAG: GIY-YIG nuclease family protein, partial [bacterium]|nr:GIY-YIG nuclease family protein [bacterium]
MEKIERLPQTPGVYLFKNDTGQVIYVGKALNIRQRVKSHFREKLPEIGFRQSLMLSQIRDVDYVQVRSEIEALLLEANLIKKYQPKYNSRLKDDKSYLYIKITSGDDFPKVLTSRREKLSGVKYFGPFPSAKTVRNTLKSLRRIFPYCNCNFKVCQKKKSCLWYEIGLDAGP